MPSPWKVYSVAFSAPTISILLAHPSSKECQSLRSPQLALASLSRSPPDAPGTDGNFSWLLGAPLADSAAIISPTQRIIMRSGNAAIRHCLNNQCELKGSGVVAGQHAFANSAGQLRLASTSSAMHTWLAKLITASSASSEVCAITTSG